MAGQSDSSSTLSAQDADDMQLAKLQPNDVPQQGTISEDKPDEAQNSESRIELLLCGVCDKEPPKYKCPKCYMSYCSLACNKIHRETHPSDAEPQAPKSVSRPELPPLRQKKATKSGIHDTLAASEQLQYLFRKYPRLPDQLLDIHNSMLPPEPDSRIPASMRAGIQTSNNWSKDKGLQHGKDTLRKLRNAKDGEALQEYTELVIYLMNEADEEKNNHSLNANESSQDVTRLLEQLLTHGNS